MYVLVHHGSEQRTGVESRVPLDPKPRLGPLFTPPTDMVQRVTQGKVHVIKETDNISESESFVFVFFRFGS